MGGTTRIASSASTAADAIDATNHHNQEETMSTKQPRVGFGTIVGAVLLAMLLKDFADGIINGILAYL